MSHIVIQNPHPPTQTPTPTRARTRIQIQALVQTLVRIARIATAAVLALVKGTVNVGFLVADARRVYPLLEQPKAAGGADETEFLHSVALNRPFPQTSNLLQDPAAARSRISMSIRPAPPTPSFVQLVDLAPPHPSYLHPHSTTPNNHAVIQCTDRIWIL